MVHTYCSILTQLQQFFGCLNFSDFYGVEFFVLLGCVLFLSLLLSMLIYLIIVYVCGCFTVFEPRHYKTNKTSVRPAKTQISLGIRPVWSESSLSAWRKLGTLATHSAHSKDSGEAGRMPRLIWVFAWRTLILMDLSCRGSSLFFISLPLRRTLIIAPLSLKYPETSNSSHYYLITKGHLCLWREDSLKNKYNIKYYKIYFY